MEGRRGAGGSGRGASAGVAQRPRIRMPRPMALPRERQSIQPIVCGQARAESLSAARKLSMSGTRSLSSRIQGEGMRSSPSSTSRMWPVRPMPPSVARKRSGSRSREHSRMRPSATRTRKARTWRPVVPATWWFLPCTSAATMPPRVMSWVPGVIGLCRPRGSSRRFMARSDRPASARSTAACASSSSTRSARGVAATRRSEGGGSDESP